MEQLSELRRSTTDGKVAGVCVMLADRWQVDPLLVRVAALLLALSSGIGVVLYAAAWALIPAEGSDRGPIDAVLPGVRKLGRTAGITLLVVVCIFAAALVGHFVPFGVGPALVIGSVWYLGWYRPEQRRRAVMPPPPPEPPRLAARPFAGDTPFTEAAAVWQRRMQEYVQTQQGPAAPSPPPTAAAAAAAHDPARAAHDPAPAHDPGYSLQAFLTHPDPVGLFPSGTTAQRGVESTDVPLDEWPTEAVPPPAEVPRETPKPARRRTGRMHLIGWSLVLVCVGTIAVLGRSFDLPFFAYPAAALLAIGLTLVIGAWLPRPRGLVFVGALLAIVIGVSTVPLPEGPTTAVTYSSVADLPAGVQQQDAGRIVADLSGLRLENDTTYAVGVDLGRISVRVPADTNVRVVWSVDVGEASVLDLRTGGGFDLHDTTVSQGTTADGPTLTIEARVGLGQLEVTR